MQSYENVVDTALFLSLACVGTSVPWVTLGLGDFAVKMVLALIMLIPFRALMGILRPQAFGDA